MTAAYRALLMSRRRLESMSKALNQSDRIYLKNTIEQLDTDIDRLAERIVEEARKRYPQFDGMAESFGITGENDTKAQEALAELLTYVDFSKSFQRIRGYVRLYHRRSKNQRYSHQIRHALVRLTMALIEGIPKARKQEGVLMKIWLTYKQETQRPAGIPAQQQG
ncbi:hypothetical protein HRbin02_01367 [Candidatus Calditenuaceae archaeon HR02]|nr:hypothetical protein HRbin02_01367 [Candidatus Calditenuaceae archaeon HR02]